MRLPGWKQDHSKCKLDVDELKVVSLIGSNQEGKEAKPLFMQHQLQLLSPDVNEVPICTCRNGIG